MSDHSEEEIEATVEEIMEDVDDFIMPPVSVENGIQFLEELETAIKARITGLRDDRGDFR